MNREDTLDYIKSKGILPDKNFGQNFLCDEEIIDSIISLSSACPNQEVIEIGPGLGALTDKLVDLGARVTAVEIDKRLNEHLQSRFEGKDINIICSDYLKLDDYNAKSYITAISNIPYYVMTPIMMKLMSDLTSCTKMTFMVEEEAIRRIDAKPGTKQYGALAVTCAVYGKVKKEFAVPRNAFIPPPHTTSAVITLTREEGLPAPEFTAFIERCFRERRKKIVNAFPDIKDAVLSLGIKEDIRAEHITPSQYRDIFIKYKASML
ncbi:MAG: 16S rRNA (adenine(1518)-N(6)/adenine(1519)-N(6))-dimethyltransferase RsmA [Saccharofermentans sp.]|nr:16S rRNA (adenine(1518)-N(6)/adenine(1519)-N(6))-dimethyltransferase RsmA [Saccharofermentans sp.]